MNDKVKNVVDYIDERIRDVSAEIETSLDNILNFDESVKVLIVKRKTLKEIKSLIELICHSLLFFFLLRSD